MRTICLACLFVAGCDASEAIGFLRDHYGELLTALGALLSLASVITGLTPSPKDDEVVRKIIAFLSFLTPRDASGTFKPPFKPPRK